MEDLDEADLVEAVEGEESVGLEGDLVDSVRPSDSSYFSAESQD